MANLKQLRDRIKSIKNTAKLTKAMKMVAAAKLTKVKKNFVGNDLYIESINNIISKFNFSEIINSQDEANNLLQKYLVTKTKDETILLIFFSSEKGLCGNFNSALTKKMKEDISNFQKKGKKVKLIVIGRKGHILLQEEFHELIIEYINISTNNSSELITKLIYIIEQQLIHHHISSSYLYFNFFKNTLLQIPSQKLLLPLEDMHDNSLTKDKENYIFEGQNLSINIIKLYLEGQINNAFIHSKASEEGARLTAMDNATNNANDLVDRLSLKLNKTRQANITQELTEIIAGAETI